MTPVDISRADELNARNEELLLLKKRVRSDKLRSLTRAATHNWLEWRSKVFQLTGLWTQLLTSQLWVASYLPWWRLRKKNFMAPNKVPRTYVTVHSERWHKSAKLISRYRLRRYLCKVLSIPVDTTLERIDWWRNLILHCKV